MATHATVFDMHLLFTSVSISYQIFLVVGSTFTFMHLAGAFVQSYLQCIQAICDLDIFKVVSLQFQMACPSLPAYLQKPLYTSQLAY